MKTPLDKKINELIDIPHTISFVVRKRLQIDNLSELPKEKRPPELMIWDDTSDEIESWLDRVAKGKQETRANLTISTKDIEG